MTLPVFIFICFYNQISKSHILARYSNGRAITMHIAHASTNTGTEYDSRLADPLTRTVLC